MSTQDTTAASGPAFPYPGLRPFEPDESHLFFGRDEHVFEMFSLLEDHRFLAVVGASGSGKSSLVRAGLLPRLRDEGLINQQDGAWRFLIMRPGNSPLDALAAACQRPDSVTGTTLAQGTLHVGDPVMTRVVLESGPKGLVRVLADARVPADDNILLLVDQFEELFRFAGLEESVDSASTLSRNESLQFVALLLETARQTERPIHVVLTMRTDFIGDCDQFDGLPQAINAGQFLVPRLSWRQQELAITAPLQLPGFESQIDRAIVDHMLNAASHERDALPLVQHALLRMWLAAAGPDAQVPSDGDSAPAARHISETEHYLPIGGLAHALDRHATELYESLTTEQQRIAACLFRCLGERSPKGQLTRRLTSVQEVAGVADVTPKEVIDVVQVFRQPGVHFLVTSPAGPVTAATSIDISHESLLRQWKLLQQWIEQESEAAAGYRRLIDAVNQGERVMEGVRLDRAVEWRDSVRPTSAWAHRYDRGEEAVDGRLPQCLQLIEDSIAEREARRQAAERVRLEREQAQAREEARAASGRRLKMLSIGATVAAVVALSGVVVAVRQSGVAQEQAAIAQELADIAEMQRTEARLLERAGAVKNLLPEVPLEALLLAIQTTSQSLSQLGEVLPQVQSSLLSAIQVAKETNRFDGYEDWVNSVAISADGKTIVTGGSDGTVRLWDLEGNPIGRPLTGHDDAVTSVAISEDGQTIVSGGRDLTVRLWRRDDTPIGELFTGHEKALTSVAFSPDGQSIVSGSEDTTVRLWRLDGQPVATLEGHQGPVRSVAFSPDGQFIASGSDDTTVRLWNLEGQPVGKAFEGHTHKVFSVAFSPDGQTIVSGSLDSSVRLWDRSGKPIGVPFKGRTSGVYSVAFSRDGRCVVSGSGEGTMWFSDLAGNPLGYPFNRHKDAVTCLAFSRDGQKIVSSSLDGKVGMWRAGNLSTWLETACDRLRNHSVLVEPESEMAEGVCQTCLEHAGWSAAEKAEFLVKQARALARGGDVKGSLAKFHQAHELDSTVNIPTETEAKQLAVPGQVKTGE